MLETATIRCGLGFILFYAVNTFFELLLKSLFVTLLLVVLELMLNPCVIPQGRKYRCGKQMVPQTVGFPYLWENSVEDIPETFYFPYLC